MEEWKSIKNAKVPIDDKFRVFQVSNLGNIRLLFEDNSIKEYGEYNKTRTIKGKKYIYIFANNSWESRPIDKLVIETFLKNPHNYPFINHLNGDKSDNKLKNLEWATLSMIQRTLLNKKGRNFHFGETNKMSKLKENEIKEIRKTYPMISMKKLATKYKVSLLTISKIIHRKSWTHIP